VYPPSKNYLLWIASLVYPQVFRKYEFSHYRKAIERGVGLCSQHAIIIAGVLKDKNIPSKIVALNGHVVATALVDETCNEWWLLDADYGVVIPRDIKTVEQAPDLVRPHYFAAGCSAKTTDLLAAMYGPNGNVVIESVNTYDPRIMSYALRYHIETFSYAAKWILPGLLTLPLLIEIWKSRPGATQ
jgi:hypothetical protein